MDTARVTVGRINDLIDWPVRLHQYVIGLAAMIFLAIYGRAVCPFINGIKVPELLVNLGAIWVFQNVVRELLFRRFASPRAGRSLPRHGYLLAMLAWAIAGIAAMTLHWLRYESFPIASHIKLMLGYWVIGAGLLAQWEYVLLENEARKRFVTHTDVNIHLERISRRVMEGYVLFTLAPSMAMALTLARYRYEGLVDRGVVIEIVFLGGFCVLLSLAVSLKFGESLRRDALSVIEGTRRIQKGERNVVLDQTRLDELGAVATGINQMCRELESKNQNLEKQIAEKDALRRVSEAVSSLLAVDKVLDLIAEKAKIVTRAEASSLLLLDPARGLLHFHVAKGESINGLADVNVPIGNGIAGRVAQTGKPLLIADAYADARFDKTVDQRTKFHTRDVITVPMTSKGEVLGVIQVLNKSGTKDGMQQFSADDMHLLEAFAAQAAVSLENARLLESTRKMADDLRVALEAERNVTIEKAKMGAYIPRSVVDEISRNREQKLALGGKTITATMLFSDIKGFTSLSEKVDPQDIVKLLNVYMTAMCEVIEREQGVVDKFMGDGIMAVFTTEQAPDHAAAAVRAGLGMQAAMDAMRKANPLLQHLQMRVGINTGEVVAGNIGSETRMDYTVIGDNVNVASRIEGVCAPDGVLVSASTWAAVQHTFIGVAQPPVHVKNRDQPVLTFQIVRG
jgi:adenylate cyclase